MLDFFGWIIVGLIIYGIFEQSKLSMLRDRIIAEIKKAKSNVKEKISKDKKD